MACCARPVEYRSNPGIVQISFPFYRCFGADASLVYMICMIEMMFTRWNLCDAALAQMLFGWELYDL